MHFQKIWVPALAVLAVGLSYQRWGWAGVAMAVGALVMWALLHFTRMLQVLKRAANRPVGYVDSAVMLNAKLRKGMPLLHVVAMTRALGALQSPADTQPEMYVWTDGSQSTVTAVFLAGKLQSWDLVRPAAEPTPAPLPTAPEAP
jgi:hypothetical protein